MHLPAPESQKPRIGISACLLSHPVRYDGQLREYPLVREYFEARCALIPVCPEVELGLGVPRPPIGLRARAQGIRLEVLHTGEDLTTPMRTLAERRVAELEALGLDGFITRSRSPSCGLLTTPVLSESGEVQGFSSGLFVATLKAHLPQLPVIDNELLVSTQDCEAFLERVLSHRRARAQERPEDAAG